MVSWFQVQVTSLRAESGPVKYSLMDNLVYTHYSTEVGQLPSLLGTDQAAHVHPVFVPLPLRTNSLNYHAYLQQVTHLSFLALLHLCFRSCPSVFPKNSLELGIEDTSQESTDHVVTV